MTTGEASHVSPTISPPAATSRRYLHVLAASVLAAVVGLLYGPTLTFDLLHYDDDVLIARNPRLYPFHPENLAAFWTDGYAGIYMPVTYSIWMGQAQLAVRAAPAGSTTEGGQVPFAPWVFHLGNVLLFLGCSLLVYRILFQLTRHVAGALCGAAVFAVHPVQVESVAWASESKGLLAWFFGFFSLTLFIDSVQAPPAPPSRRRTVLVAATAMFALALLSKPSAVSVPLIAIVLAMTVLSGESFRRGFPWLMGWTALAIAAAFWANHVQRNYVLESLPWSHRLVNALHALLWDFRLLLCPIIPAAPDSGRDLFSLNSDVGIAWLNRAWVHLLFAAIVLRFLHSTNRFNLAAVGIVIAGVMPVLGFVPYGFQEIAIAADRYLLPATFGLALAVAASCAIRPGGGNGWLRYAAIAVFCSLLVFDPAGYVANWRNDRSLAEHAIRVNPNSRLFRTNRAVLRLRSGDMDGAIEDAQIAAALDPPFLPACQNLAVAWHRKGEFQEAMAALDRGLARSPNDVNLLTTKAEILSASRRYPDAAKVLDQIVQAHPDDRQSKLRLASALILAGSEKTGLDLMQSVEGKRFDPPQDRFLVAHVWETAGEPSEAIRQYQAILDIWGEVPAVSLRMAWILAVTPVESVRDPKRAIQLANRAVHVLRDNSPAALDVLAAAQAANGDFKTALDTADRARNLAEQRKEFPLAASIQSRIETYRRGIPYTAPAKGAAAATVVTPSSPPPHKPSSDRTPSPFP